MLISSPKKSRQRKKKEPSESPEPEPSSNLLRPQVYGKRTLLDDHRRKTIDRETYYRPERPTDNALLSAEDTQRLSKLRNPTVPLFYMVLVDHNFGIPCSLKVHSEWTIRDVKVLMSARHKVTMSQVVKYRGMVMEGMRIS